jgi:hypothetical protein
MLRVTTASCIRCGLLLDQQPTNVFEDSEFFFVRTATKKCWKEESLSAVPLRRAQNLDTLTATFFPLREALRDLGIKFVDFPNSYTAILAI